MIDNDTIPLMYLMPYYLNIVIDRLKEKEWLIHSFESIDINEIYNPANYLANMHNDIFYTLKIDLNIFQYITNGFKKDKLSEEHKDGICLIIFCQLANITIDPNYAIYEKIKYSNDLNHLDEILEDLELFRNIDNTDPDILIKYVIDEIKTNEISQEIKLDKDEFKAPLTQYKRLTEWDSMYVIVLFIIYSNSLEKISNFEKLKYFLQVITKEFRLSLVCLTFAVIFFGKKPIAKMMKYKSNKNEKEKKSAIINMTWDLYYINRFFRDWQEKKENEEYLYASGDNALKAILEIGILYQRTHNFNIFKDHFCLEQLKEIDFLTSQEHLNSVKRMYLVEDWNTEYRQNLILKYEKLLEISN